MGEGGGQAITNTQHTCQLFTKPWTEILSGVIQIMPHMQPHKLVAQISENFN